MKIMTSMAWLYWRYSGSDTPLPGLTLEVEDRDVSENAEVSLTLEPVSENAESG